MQIYKLRMDNFTKGYNNEEKDLKKTEMVTKTSIVDKRNKQRRENVNEVVEILLEPKGSQELQLEWKKLSTT